MNTTAKQTLADGLPLAAPSGSDEERLRTLTKELRELHASAENAAWDGGTDNAKAKMEAFSVAAWNHVPWILDATEHLGKWVYFLAQMTQQAQEQRAALFVAIERLMPYLAEDYEGGVMTPGYKEAIEKARALIGLPLLDQNNKLCGAERPQQRDVRLEKSQG